MTALAAPDAYGTLTEPATLRIHRRLPDRGTMLMVGAGWHMHLDMLVARVSGAETEPFWDGWVRLKTEYDQRLPA